MKASSFYRVRKNKQNRSGPANDEKIEGILENIFGVQLKKDGARRKIGPEKVEGLLTHVFGVKLPKTGVSPARSVLLQEYARTLDP